MQTSGISLDTMLLHQNALHMIQQELEQSDSLVLFESLESDIEFQNFYNKEAASSLIPLSIKEEALNFFITVRSVIATNGTDKSLLGHFTAVIETLLQHLSTMCSNPISETDKQKTASFCLVLRLMCMFREEHKTNPTFRLRSDLPLMIYNTPDIYQSLIRCGELCNTVSLIETMNDDDEPFHALEFSMVLLLNMILRCHTDINNQIVSIPRKQCSELWIHCISISQFVTVRDAAYQLFFVIVESNIDKHLLFDYVTELGNLLASALHMKGLQKNMPITGVKGTRITRTHEDEFKKLDYLLEFIGTFLSFLPTEFQKLIIIDKLIHGYLSTDTWVGKSCHTNTVSRAINTIGDYFVSYNQPVYIPDDESWDIRKQILYKLIWHHEKNLNIFNTSLQLNAIFQGLANLIVTIEKSHSIELIHSNDIRLSRRNDIATLLLNMIHSNKSFFKIMTIESDPTIQKTISDGWKLLFEKINHLESEKSIFLYSILTKYFISLLNEKYKYVWRTTLTTIQAMFESFQLCLSQLYTSYHTGPIPIVLSSFIDIYHLCHHYDNYTQQQQQEKQQFLLKQFQLIYNNHHTIEPFSKWYRSLTHLFFNSVFLDLIHLLSSILHDAEEPSPETLQSLGKTLIEELSLNQLKSQDAAFYRTELRRCIGTCFKVFGARDMLRLDHLSLKKLTTTSLSIPSFAYETNSWVIPLMASNIKYDELCYFRDTLLPLAQELLEKASRLGSSDIEKIESRHYHRLVEQLWSLLPGFFNEALDVIDAFTELNSQFINILISRLDIPTIREHICLGLTTLCRQISGCLAEQQDIMESSIEWKPSIFFYHIWVGNSPSNHLINITPLSPYANKIMGLLVVRYLQMHRQSIGVSNSIQTAEQSDSHRTAQIFRETIRSLTVLCDPVLLEQNLRNFSSTWTSAVGNAAYQLTGTSQSDNTHLKQTSFLSASECGALVDIVVALIPRLLNDTVYGLFDIFLKLLEGCTSGILGYKQSDSKLNNRKQYGIFRGNDTDTQKSLQTLQCLMRRSYKGLKHVTERLLPLCSDSESIISTITPTNFLLVWKTYVSARGATRMVSSLKVRMAALRPFVMLLGRLNSNWELKEEQDPHLYINRQPVIKEIIQQMIPELLLGLSETNKSLQDEAIDLLKAVTQGPISLDELIMYLLPGLASDTSCMKAATSLALATLLSSHGDQLSQDLLKDIQSLAIVLLQDHQKQVFRQSLRLIRGVQRFLSPDIIKATFHTYILPILTSIHAVTYRLAIRNIIDKAVRKIGILALEPIFPSSHIALLHYVERSLRKTRAKNQRLRLAQDAAIQKTSSSTLNHAIIHNKKMRLTNHAHDAEEYDSDEDNMFNEDKYSKRHEGENVTGIMHHPPTLKCLLDAFEAESDHEGPRSIKSNKNQLNKRSLSKRDGMCHTRLVESSEFNLLSNETSGAILLGNDRDYRSLKKQKGSGTLLESNNDQFKIDKQGRFIVEDIGFGTTATPQGNNPFLGTQPTMTSTTKTHTKPTEKFSLSHLKEKREALKHNKPTRRHGHFIQKSGDSFKAQKGSGDISRGSGTLPYSYIRLNPKMVKEKYRSDVIKTFRENGKIKKGRRGKEVHSSKK